MILERKAIADLVERGAIFYVSHSAGKDSQAMYIALSRFVPADQICVVHADLGEIEWDGVQDHINSTISHRLNVVKAGKTFFEMVMHRFLNRPEVPSWPSSATRQCTSDLKRGPIHKFIRNDMKSRGVKLALNCTGIRAAESPGRAKKQPLKLNKTLSVAGREVWEYMPIHHLMAKHVFWIIANADQKPFWAYERNTRLSCVFCIMGCENDLKHGAEQRPDLYQKYLDIEKATGWTMFNGKSLRERVEGTFVSATGDTQMSEALVNSLRQIATKHRRGNNIPVPVALEGAADRIELLEDELEKVRTYDAGLIVGWAKECADRDAEIAQLREALTPQLDSDVAELLREWAGYIQDGSEDRDDLKMASGLMFLLERQKVARDVLATKETTHEH